MPPLRVSIFPLVRTDLLGTIEEQAEKRRQGGRAIESTMFGGQNGYTSGFTNGREKATFTDTSMTQGFL